MYACNSLVSIQFNSKFTPLNGMFIEAGGQKKLLNNNRTAKANALNDAHNWPQFCVYQRHQM